MNQVSQGKARSFALQLTLDFCRGAAKDGVKMNNEKPPTSVWKNLFGFNDYSYDEDENDAEPANIDQSVTHDKPSPKVAPPGSSIMFDPSSPTSLASAMRSPPIALTP